MKRNFAFILLTIALLFTMGAVQSFAASDDDPRALAVDLYADQYKAFSDTCDGTYKIIWGRKSEASAHGVWFVAEYYYNGKWVEDDYARVFIPEDGSSFDETSTYRFGNSHTCHLKVDTYGIFKKSIATGYIRNKNT